MGDAGTGHGRFSRAIQRGDLWSAELAARELGGLGLEDALALCALMARHDPERFERAALRWLTRLIDERGPSVSEVALAAAALAELRHGERGTGREALARVLRR